MEDFSQDDLLDSVEQIFHKVCVRGSGLVRVDFTLQRIFVLTQESASDVGSETFNVRITDRAKHTRMESN